MNEITVNKASDVDPAELAKLNEENARKNLTKGTGVDDQPVVEHQTVKSEQKPAAPKVESPTK